MNNKPIIRLPLEGAENVRDIGGYVGDNKKVGNFGVFLRGNELVRLTKNDNEFLKNYGLTDVIDLRSEEVSLLKPDGIDREYFKYHLVPLLTEKFNENLALEKENFKMGEGYKLILENKIAIKNIFEILGNAEGCTIFHCTAGKDRTGLVAMLILGLCGVSKKDIVANYEVTFTYVPVLMDEVLNQALAYSLPEYIKTAIEFVEENYGTYREYLKSCEISDEILDKIKSKYLD